MLPSLSHLRLWEESTRDLAPYLGGNFLTLIEGPLYLWLQSHLFLTLGYGGDQLQINIQLQIYISVVIF